MPLTLLRRSGSNKIIRLYFCPVKTVNISTKKNISVYFLSLFIFFFFFFFGKYITF